MKKSNEDRKARIASLKEAASLVSENAVAAFLATTNKKYSPLNVQMILSQNENATVVAGFNDWKKSGRIVRKGEKGIAIFAPVNKKVEDALGNEDDIIGFRVVYVFDITQTDELVAVADRNAWIDAMVAEENEIERRSLFAVEETATKRILSLA